jgi:GABA permease
MTDLRRASQSTGLSHGLKQRHMTMIALGGVIGAGLFVGSRVVIAQAGPASVISFLLTGLLVVLVMKMLGEMSAALPRVGSFYEYARLAHGDLAAFLTGWMYWYFWVIVVALEAIAGADLIRYWLPEIPAWVLSLGLMLTLTAANLTSVGTFGEAEFWLSSIKVTAIVVFLLIGAAFLLGFGPAPSPGLANLTIHGGFAPNGILPVLAGAVSATGFYFGAELVTIAAAEAKESVKTVVRATNAVIFRVLAFYVLSTLLTVIVVPWDSLGVGAAPFVTALRAMRIPGAGAIMNAVILSAVVSALNSGLYASSRMLFALTQAGDAPKALSRLSRKGVPVTAILIGTVFGYAAVVMSYVSPGFVFAFLVNSYGTVALFVYLLIALSELSLRRRLERDAPELLIVRVPGFPYLTYVAIVGMVGVLVAMAFIPDQRAPLALGIVSAALIVAGYWAKRTFGTKRAAVPVGEAAAALEAASPRG